MVPDSLRRRVETPRRPIVQHARIISNTRYEAVRQATRLERRISDVERLVGFLTDMMLGMISACFAVAGAAYAGVGFYWEETMAAAVIAFLIAMWLSSFLFPNATRWCLEIVPPSSLGALAAIQRHASKRWLISKRSGCAAELIRLGVEQKPKRHCSLEHTRLSDEQTTKRPVT